MREREVAQATVGMGVPASATRPGDRSPALDQLVLQVYPDLQDVARSAIRRQRLDTPARPTELVHEAYVRLRAQRTQWAGREHLLGVAARIMRRIIVDRLRAKHRLKRGGGWQKVDLAELEVPEPNDRRFLALADALERLRAMDHRKADLVELRYVAGFTLAEAARAVGLSLWSAKRSWSVAKLWLLREIEKGQAS